MPERLEISPWITAPADLRPPLRGDLAADVAVVGAGYTGLSAALALKRAGVDVVVLERDFAGFGASGRNAGHLTPTIGKDLPTLLMLFGRTAHEAGHEGIYTAHESLESHGDPAAPGVRNRFYPISPERSRTPATIGLDSRPLARNQAALVQSPFAVRPARFSISCSVWL